MKRLTLVLFLFFCSLLTTGCLDTEPKGPPVYGEFRLSEKSTGVDLVGFAVLNSRAECRSEKRDFMKRFFGGCENCTEASFECISEVPGRYKPLFENKPIHATYLVLETDDADERDGRMVIFGVPSSVAKRACPQLKQMLKRTYKGSVSCVEGTVG